VHFFLTYLAVIRSNEMLKKRKRLGEKAKAAAKKAAEAAAVDEAGDVESGGEDSDDIPQPDAAGDAEDDDFFETPDEKRVRLAKDYLKTLEGSASKDQIQERLTQDVAEQQRRTRSQVSGLNMGQPRFLKGHKEPTTCIAMSSDERTIFSGGKDCAILRWDIETGKKDVFPGGRNCFDSGGHFEHVLGLCLLEQRSLLASAGVDRLVRLWDLRCSPGAACTKKFMGHANAVSSVAAEPDCTQLYSASLDKSLKVWDVTAGRCVDTLFGHVQGITSMDIYHKNRPITGGSDKTARVWKVDKETHLMFSKHTYSVDAVGVLDHERFVSGSQDGTVMLWTQTSKKPLASTPVGDGKQWITSLGTMKGCDVFFSGSTDGNLHAWRAASRAATETDGKKGGGITLEEACASVHIPGCLNGIAVGQRLLACAVGKSHKLGSWYMEKRAKNGILLVPLSYEKS
jgi:ribosomal RNA-processing protein 9